MNLSFLASDPDSGLLRSGSGQPVDAGHAWAGASAERRALLPLPRLSALLFTVLPLTVLLLVPSAQAHHLIELLHLQPSPLTGLLSGLAHPWFGPDHLLFLLALALVGLRQRRRWMLGLLFTGLLGTALGLLLPGLPAPEALVSFTLVLEALVLLERLPAALLLPAFALHGYVLSGSVLGWTTAPISFYLLGLLLSQGGLLLISLYLLQRACGRLALPRRRLLAAVLLGCGCAFTWSALVA
jgi:urease accessory protein